MIRTGTRVNVNFNRYIYYGTVPAAFPQIDMAFWWGVVQSYMFRLQPSILERIQSQVSKLGNGKGFPLKPPIVDMHVRHSDKHTDGFHD